MTQPSDTPTVAPGGGIDSKLAFDAIYGPHYAAVWHLVGARDALYEFGTHAEGCEAGSYEDAACSCGLDDAQNAVRDALQAGYAGLRSVHAALPALLASQRDGALIDELEAWTKGDQTICPPGNHGGGVGNWLVAREDDARGDRHGNWCDEYEAPTLRGALSAMSASRPSSPPVAPEPTYLCAQCHLNGSGRFLWTEALGCANPECVTKTHPHFAAAPEPENTR